MTARDVLHSALCNCGLDNVQDDEAPFIIFALKKSGYSIVHESEIHGATKRRCIEILETTEIVVPLAPGVADGASIAVRQDIEAIRALPDKETP